MQDMIKGRLILPEPEPVGCPRLNFGRPCGRVDYHHHDEAFGGGGMSRYFTQGASPPPKKNAASREVRGLDAAAWRQLIELRKQEGGVN